MMPDYSEDALAEQPAIALFAELGWATVDAFHETFRPGGGSLGRESQAEVVLMPRLRAALRRLNPALPSAALDAALEELTRDRGTLSVVAANRAIYRLLKDGVKVAYRDPDDAGAEAVVRVIDWEDPAQNDYLLASQFQIASATTPRRADLVGFVNGLPLVFVELKAMHKQVKDAYDRNLRDYREAIPQVFRYNAFIILSNSRRARLGTITATWEQFAEWKRIESEEESGCVALETLIRATCAPARLLDLVENFTLFSEAAGGLVKIVARNHQVLGVNNAFAAVGQIGANGGRLGVFWHTQGAGKSYSMVFFSQKVLRKRPGAWTFVVVTDREDLDEQIYGTFAAVGAETEKEHAVRAGSGEHLARLLRETHRYVFTLIHKFGPRPPDAAGQPAPISERSDIIVMADEAHRSQYDTLALNMHNALPHAGFIGFTGTPLLVGEERTREVFGDYVSKYDFQQAIDDGATVPLYYENRIPELQLTNEQLNDDLAAVVEAAALDEAQEAKLEREFARQYHLITRDERLETIAADIVAHFLGRGVPGKAMVVCIDKATAIRMYDKVRRHWLARLAEVQAQALAERDAARVALARQADYMRETDMAVVVSQAQNEVEDMRAKGLEIAPHRYRMLHEDLATKFKDPTDRLRLVFVCAMWMTGFDVPAVSTIYLDKPLRNHTLMQAIARANRVFGDKPNGLIVDYAGIFRNLQQALAIYGTGAGGTTPVRDKAELVHDLDGALAETATFCAAHGIDPAAILAARGFARAGLLADAVEALLIDDATRAAYLTRAAAVARLYRAILPDRAANTFTGRVALFAELAAQMQTDADPPDISRVTAAVSAVLDASIAPSGYQIREPPAGAARGFDLRRLDLARLQAQFSAGHRNTATQRLRAALAARIAGLVRLNRTRADYQQRFETLIAEYNAGARSVDLLFAELTALAQALDAEAQRHVAEHLSEEELALFDLLTQPAPALTPADKEQVKSIAHTLLATLKDHELVLDWRKRQQAQAQVRVTIGRQLVQLPDAYSQELYEQKCETVYRHIYEAYYGEGQSVYAEAA